MAFPVVVTTNTTSAFLTSAFSLNLPASIASGDILVLLVHRAGGASQTFTFPAGWTSLASVASGTGTFAVFWKLADGTEGSTVSVSSTVATGQNTRSLVYRISGGLSVEISSVATGTSTNPDSASLSPSWGSAGTLWIPAIAMQGASSSVSSYPTNYSTDNLSLGTTTLNLAMATRQLTASSEDPGSYTYGASVAWTAYTLAVRPSAVAAAAAVGLIARRIFNPVRGPSRGLTPTQAYPRLPYLFSVTAEPGAYATSGVAQTLNIGLHLLATAGAYLLTGVAATLAAALHGLSLVAATGAYVLAGVGTGGVKTKLLVAAAGAYALSGVAALAKYARVTAVGAYSLSGKAAFQAVARASAVGAYTLTGVASSKALKRLSSAGAYVYAGSIATLAKSGVFLYTLTATAGSYALAGKATVLSWLGPVTNLFEKKRKTAPTLTKARQTSPALTLARSVKATLVKIGGRRRLDD